jgi:hypothetical protein
VVIVAESKRWIVTTSGDRPLNDVARDIKAAGFVIDEVLDQIGIITGSATDSVAEAVPAYSWRRRRVAGSAGRHWSAGLRTDLIEKGLDSLLPTRGCFRAQKDIVRLRRTLYKHRGIDITEESATVHRGPQRVRHRLLTLESDIRELGERGATSKRRDMTS